MSIGARRLSRANNQQGELAITYSSVSVLSRRTPASSDTAYATDMLSVTPSGFRPRLDQYGGSLELPPATATGRFYVTNISGRSWLITPLGNRFLSIGLNSINIQDTITSESNATTKYGDLTDNWANATNTELKSYGFNTAGAWSDTTYLTKPSNNSMAYTTVGYFMRDYGKSSVHTTKYSGRVSSGSGHDDYTNDAIYVFEPEFATFAQQRAQQIATGYGADPYYIGVMSDNELPFSATTLLDNNLALSDTADPMYLAVRTWLAARSKSPSNYNDADRKAWVGYVYGEYTRIIREALDAADPAMLYLGSRLHQKSSIESPPTFAIAKQYVDVFTLNYYNYWEPDHTLLTNSLAGSPFMITEFYTKALDAVDVYGNQFGNTSGAGWCVQTDADRGRFYQNFTLGVLSHPNGVGWHWFRYTDNDTQEQSSDPSNVDSNKGLYKLNYTIYSALSAAMKTVHQGAYRIAAEVTGPQNPPSETVQWWLTNSNGSQLYASQADLNWESYDGNPGTRPINIDNTQQYQSMLGFGAAITDAASSVVWSMPTINRNAFLDDMFGSDGLKLDVVRLPMGSSDFARFAYTYDDSVPPDPTLTNFSIATDETYTIPLLQAALQRNPNLKIFAVPWSAPAWMKTNGSLNAGSLKPEYYSVYAQYFVKFIQAYQAHGLSVYAVTPQNEPLHITGSYPSMSMTAAEQATFIGQHLGPAFAAAGIVTRIITYDHNWDNTSYVNTVFNDPQAEGYTSGSAWHAYAGDVTAQTTIHNAYPNKDIYFTEITASQPDNFGSDLQWFMRNIGIGAPYNWARTGIYWNLALDENNGPLNGGYTTGQGIVRITSTNSAVTRYSTYYGLKHLSHRLKPGAVRIGCTNYGTGYVLATTYRNPDGSMVCHLLCDAQSAQTFKLIANGKSVSFTLQPGDVVTCTWQT